MSDELKKLAVHIREAELYAAIALLNIFKEQVRKNALQEAAQRLKYYGHSANLVDEIRELGASDENKRPDPDPRPADGG